MGLGQKVLLLQWPAIEKEVADDLKIDANKEERKYFFKKGKRYAQDLIDSFFKKETR